MPDWLYLPIALALLDWGYARICLRDERRWRHAHNAKLHAYLGREDSYHFRKWLRGDFENGD